MARWGRWMMHLLVCVWSSLNTNLVIHGSGMVYVDLSNTTVMMEGSALSLVCQVDLQSLRRDESAVNIEWVQETMNATLTLARAGASFNPRYTLQDCAPRELTIIEELFIDSLRKEDAGVYSCLVVDPNNGNTLASATLNVSVLYFPASIDCYPDGPIEVSEGSTIGMSCTTEIGNPPVSFYVRDSHGISDGWTLTQTANTQTLSLEGEIASTGGEYECEIKSNHTGEFSGMLRSCLIRVIPTRPTTRRLTTAEPFTSVPKGPETAEPQPGGPVTTETPTQNPDDAPWITVSVISLIFSTISLLIDIFILVYLKGLKKEAGPAAIQTGFSPYTELQLQRCIKSKSYAELKSPSITEEKEKDYEYPTLDLEDSYDDVQEQQPVQRPYQNMKSV